MTIFEEQKGVHSMRRFLAFLSFGNSAALSWFDTPWQVIGLWILAGLILLGLTTLQEVTAFAHLRTSSAISGASVDGDEAHELIGFKGKL